MTFATLPDPATRATRDTILAFHEAFNAREVDRIMALMTTDCVFENTYPPPDGTRLVGAEAVQGFWNGMFAGTQHLHFGIEEVFVAGERGVLRWRYEWVNTAGEAGHIRGVDVFRVRGDLIAEKLSYVKG